MKAMIMSAGKGTRVRPLSYDAPKPMFAIANKPVLHHTLKLLKRHNIKGAMINLGLIQLPLRSISGTVQATALI